MNKIKIATLGGNSMYLAVLKYAFVGAHKCEASWVLLPPIAFYFTLTQQL
jgi:hypothetical protein